MNERENKRLYGGKGKDIVTRSKYGRIYGKDIKEVVTNYKEEKKISKIP